MGAARPNNWHGFWTKWEPEAATNLPVQTAQEGIEALSVKVGTVLLVLGGMHFFNLFIFSRMRRRATMHNAPPPVYPDAFTPVQEV